ncbi:uncharacterized protein K460DRAFT_406722 [Cucurbitaria berberidis CBS 394.84]|uniref:Uncharacterized protein n=1 Tax=Cucurbitaria berberidis CBS 394.84 TaxID=1168544 RepID=A0A9P4GJY3_9PLEO|nr:uncharacterized protein K460DRAFT_406722 [Cucurbitaria berberidis CBS 394.84]KAF1846521.1 hypothetical protein K460DRAFT_406722 [Cucurbitaria berberidis CBS 394.84]
MAGKTGEEIAEVIVATRHERERQEAALHPFKKGIRKTRERKTKASTSVAKAQVAQEDTQIRVACSSEQELKHARSRRRNRSHKQQREISPDLYSLEAVKTHLLDMKHLALSDAKAGQTKDYEDFDLSDVESPDFARDLHSKIDRQTMLRDNCTDITTVQALMLIRQILQHSDTISSLGDPPRKLSGEAAQTLKNAKRSHEKLCIELAVHIGIKIEGEGLGRYIEAINIVGEIFNKVAELTQK